MDSAVLGTNRPTYRVPVEIVTVCGGDETSAIYWRRKAGCPPDPIADLYIEDGRFVAIVYFDGLPCLSVSLRVFPIESLKAA
jgi:hypothetical protein